MVLGADVMCDMIDTFETGNIAVTISDKPFNVNDSCNGCGKCAKECPLHNINMVDGKPRWNGNCTNCMSCYHRCPNNAINFGKQTCGKGQYYFKK
jgi:heterodisulfide reductase subunit A-like polyferredoxin